MGTCLEMISPDPSNDIKTMMDGVEITRTSGRQARHCRRNSGSRTSWLMEGVFSGGGHSQRSSRLADEDEEALIWAAIEKLPTYDRLRKSVIQSLIESDLLGNQMVSTEVDVTKLDINDKQNFINRVFTVAEEDNEKYLKKFRERIYKVGIKLPTIEVRFENLSVEGNCHIGTRALPTLPNVTRNIVESSLSMLGINLAKRTKVKILKGVSGVVKPSRLTLLLGPPSSGKSTLLLALAGLLDSNLKVEGEITYNGYKLNEFVPRKTSAYISQNDLHISNMTVRETLDFSARCQGVGTRYDLVSELARREKDAGIFPEADLDLFMKATAIEGAKSSLITDYTLKILGLDICKDSIIGDEMQRGISGGQRKRVTTGEMIVGPTKALFMDEISTGLDSSTTYQIVKCMQQIVHLTEATILMSLLQPTPETFDLFDDIILLSEGVIVYQGPREHILEFFESCGFRCPERKSIADFLQEVSSRKDQELYWSDRNKPYHYVSVLAFAEMFKRFHVGMHLHHELSVPFDKSQCHKAALAWTKYSLTKVEILKSCWDREWILVKRNAVVHVSMLLQIIVLAIVSSTVFLRVYLHTRNEEDGALYINAIIFCLMTSVTNGFPEISLIIQRLPVFYKQRELLFHPAWAFTLPTFVLQLPITALKSIVWVAVTYYTMGLAPEPSRFFKHLLLTFLMQQMACGMFRLISGVCRTMIIANTGGSIMFLLLVIIGGFILHKDSLPNWIEWGYWVSPLPYAYNALAVNEMFAPRWMNKLASDNITRLGVAVLNNVGCFPNENWYWIGAVALMGFTILFNVLFTIVLAYLSNPGKPQAIITEEAANEMESEPRLNRNVQKNDPFSLSLSSTESNSTREMEIQRRRSKSNCGGPSREADSSSQMTDVPAPKRGMVLHFIPLSMSFNCVNYFVDMPPEIKEQGVGNDRLQLLKEVTGAFRPGVLTALMGVSGAGKTTLMDVLAGRKTGGFIEGDIRISGFPKQQETFARISGYCEQNDIHSPQVTVRESLIFSAFLRLPKEISKQEKITFVDELMELVELNSLKNVTVGHPGTTGLSTEQRKRLTIAVELVANPSIIFMDEPTSGLDARAAAIVMRAVRNTVDTGRTVVCTIHQPNIDIFEAFDELLLMKRGGEMIYSGPLGRNSHKMIEYFEEIPGVPKIKEKYNPATWMLEVSSVAAEHRLGIDFAEHYKSSSLYQRNKDLVKELSTPPPGAKDFYFATQYSESTWGQFKLCLWKQQWTYWRSPNYNLVRFCFTLMVALIIGVLLWRIGGKRESTNDLITILGAMQNAVLSVGINSCSSVQPVVVVERSVFYRERAAGMYSALPYALALVVSEIPYVFVQAAFYTLIVFAMLAFEWTVSKFFWFFFVTFFTFLFYTYYGMMTVSITPNLQVASIVASSFYGLFSLFSGFIIPRPRIPKWWVWAYWICPLSWTIYGLIVSQFGDVEDTVKSPGIVPDPTTKWYVENKLGYDPNFMGQVAAVLVSFPVLCALLFAFGLRTFNFQTR